MTTKTEEAPAHLRSQRKSIEGVVVSDKMDRTRVVVISRTERHPLYKKVLRRKTRCYAHDESNATHIGDRVELMETRPLSKLKRWRIVRIVGKAKLS